jgi:hypothetical protein
MHLFYRCHKIKHVLDELKHINATDIYIIRLKVKMWNRLICGPLNMYYLIGRKFNTCVYTKLNKLYRLFIKMLTLNIKPTQSVVSTWHINSANQIIHV